MRVVSLRRTALGWMTALLAGIGLAAMLAAYVLARGEASDFLDGQLRQVALNAGPGLPDADAPPAADQDPEDQLAVSIWKDGRLLRSDRGVDERRPERTGYADVVMGGEAWRTYATANGTTMVRVAQREVVRTEFARNAALGALAPLLLLIPLSWIVVGWAMDRVLRRLDDLVRDLAGRGATANGPLSPRGVPAEVAPLVEAMNGLILRLQAALDAQKRFVADAAHELRTPLAAMQIQVGALDGGQDDRRMALARGIARASRLVDQLLRLARLDDDIAGSRETVDLGQVLLDCVADHVVLAQGKDIDLGVDIETPVRIPAVRDELTTLFSSLIDNALRYTPAGGQVDVTLRLRDGKAVVTVRDTGCGLPPGSASRLFDRFFRAAPPGIEGTGLGLAIARRAAERHGLSLTVENRRDGQGAIAEVRPQS
ncbi:MULTISPECIES: ATP-binding protein [unclassified Methylobacterium]|uniref:ATP-binding protein n=1 Tax=unclassified Methylobacterium TaxID=2615210 RepID=UPI0011C1E589|nr:MULTISPECIES: ATP-binding protein [unclassified Methylobacterium]QEE39876.1 two-component sensor histidine kinase [Methylobacterium sp. WL1]TXN55959.1 two-component sensor histidine kinase [Methylobacterium sp. WL2]